MGAFIFGLLGFSDFLSHIGQYILLFVGISGTLLFFNPTIVHFEIETPSVIFGFAFVAVSLNFIRVFVNKYRKRSAGGIIILGLYLVGYSYIIPSYAWEIYRAANYVKIPLWTLIGAEGVISLIRILKSGTWSNIKQKRGEKNDA